MRGPWILLLVLTMACASVPDRSGPGGGEVELRIVDVHHSPALIDPGLGEEAAIRFRLTAAASVEVRIYDGRDFLVRSEALGRLSSGGHEFVWDGRDWEGRPVPPEAYTYTLVARAGDTEIEHDLTDLISGELLFRGEGPHFRLEQGGIQYRLRQNARVSLRIGLARGGPLLATLLDWAPRTEGSHSEAWDGSVAEGLLELGSHPNLDVRIQAFSLPPNAILVGPEMSAPVVIEDLPRGVAGRAKKAEAAVKIMAYAQQSMDERRSFEPRLVWPDGLKPGSDGSVRVMRPVPIEIDLDPSERARAMVQRIEVSLYLDGIFVQEVEQAFLPMTWTLDPTGLAPGRHFVTVNLSSYEGNFGTTTVAVDVEAPDAPLRGSDP